MSNELDIPSPPNPVWYAPILGTLMGPDGFRITHVLPSFYLDTAIIMGYSQSHAKFVVAAVYEHQFRGGAVPKEWDHGNYFHEQEYPVGECVQHAFAKLVWRASNTETIASLVKYLVERAK